SPSKRHPQPVQGAGPARGRRFFLALSRWARGKNNEATTRRAKDAVAQGYAASSTWMCCARALEQDAELRDAAYPCAAAAPSGVDASQRCCCCCCCCCQQQPSGGGDWRSRERSRCRVPALSPAPLPVGE